MRDFINLCKPDSNRLVHSSSHRPETIYDLRELSSENVFRNSTVDVESRDPSDFPKFRYQYQTDVRRRGYVASRICQYLSQYTYLSKSVRVFIIMNNSFHGDPCLFKLQTLEPRVRLYWFIAIAGSRQKGYPV